jgi:hypothetical protein
VADQLLKKWTDRALARVSSRVSDARAHAERGALEAVKVAPAQGRFSSNFVARRGEVSLGEAFPSVDRLNALLAELAGDFGLVRDAYQAFYRDSLRRQREKVPAEHRREDPHFEAKSIAEARNLSMHGYDARRELEGPIRGAAAAVGLAIGQKASDVGRVDPLAAWQRKTVSDLSRSVMTLLGDARVALDRKAQLDAVKPRLLDLTELEDH